MKILSIDTSCDETSAAVTENLNVLSNIIWSQASLHAKWGGVVPSLAQRAHKERIDWVIERALIKAEIKINSIDYIAVTVGPCLAIAGEVGINKAKELAKKFKKHIIAVNHLEGHILSPLALPRKSNKGITLSYPSFGLVISGGHTELILIKKIGEYSLIAQTNDDALGEALDKAARMLGFGYPGGAILEKIAKKGDAKTFSLPLPLTGKEDKNFYSYSGLKTAMLRLFESVKNNNQIIKQSTLENLSASFQEVAFKHLIRITKNSILNLGKDEYKYLLVGGGVSSNTEVRKQLRKMANNLNLKILFPYTKRLCSDNAAMIGIAAYYKALNNNYERNINIIDREPRAKIDKNFSWQEN